MHARQKASLKLGGGEAAGPLEIGLLPNQLALETTYRLNKGYFNIKADIHDAFICIVYISMHLLNLFFIYTHTHAQQFSTTALLTCCLKVKSGQEHSKKDGGTRTWLRVEVSHCKHRMDISFPFCMKESTSQHRKPVHGIRSCTKKASCVHDLTPGHSLNFLDRTVRRSPAWEQPLRQDKSQQPLGGAVFKAILQRFKDLAA